MKLHVGHILAINKVIPLAFGFMIHQSLPGAQGGQAEVARVGESVGEVFALNVTSEGGGGPVPELATQPTRVIFVFPRSKVLVQIFIGEKRTLQIKKHVREESVFISTNSHTLHCRIQTYIIFIKHLFVSQICRTLSLVTIKSTPCIEDSFTVKTFMSEHVGKMLGFYMVSHRCSGFMFELKTDDTMIFLIFPSHKLVKFLKSINRAS